ncbi:PTS mannitol transporter subunit IICB [Mycoplasmopsis pulmonis]|nr:PTS mannitol transporter subunit IICB [Mycoplasmopsis pulmonis]VEU68518.1 PTS system mannitol-specific (MtlA)-like IIB domain protein [Mycoplasmopsis pulmonis]
MNLFLKKAKVKIQIFGASLSSMIMPIIGIFIAWGLLTSFFIPTGWIPNATLATMVGTGIVYVIPVLIAYLGGKKVYQHRGAVIGALVSIAAIAAGQSQDFIAIAKSSSPMILASMIFAPLAAFILKHLEKFWISKIKPGYEMLVNNFSLVIIGFILLFPTFYLSIYVIGYLNLALSYMVDGMQKYKLYPILAIVVEPAKVLFLNNAINHGVFTMLGQSEVLEKGKSILFLLESNPGPGLGVLIAWIIFGKKEDKNVRTQAISSSPIHLFGGIHEVYFPFVLLKPVLIVSTIAGGAIGNLIFQIFNVGALAPVSPGSIIAAYIQVNKSANDLVGLTLGILSSALVSLFVSSMILAFDRIFKKNKKVTKEKTLESALQESKANKLKIDNKKEYEFIFVCIAGMGSSAMGATIFKNILKNNNINNIKVSNKSISNLDGQEKNIITINHLVEKVKEKNSIANIYSIRQFLDKNDYQNIVDQIKNEKI